MQYVNMLSEMWIIYKEFSLYFLTCVMRVKSKWEHYISNGSLFHDCCKQQYLSKFIAGSFAENEISKILIDFSHINNRNDGILQFFFWKVMCGYVKVYL